MHVLNTIGLSFNILGVIILFKFCFPQPNFEEGVGIGLEDNTIMKNGKTVKEHNKRIIKNKKNYTIFAIISLSMIIIGFVLQLIATWI